MYLKGIIHLAALLPFCWTLWLGLSDNLGADPVEALLHFSGISSFNLLLLTLSVSPLAQLTRQPMLMRCRRLLGLYAFFYAFSHLLFFIFFELQFEWLLLLQEIIQRPYITVGFAALLVLGALAITSVNKIKKAMGSAWQRLHNWIYPAALLIALHYIWSVKSDITQPILYWLALLYLLSLRRHKLLSWLNRRRVTVSAQKRSST